MVDVDRRPNGQHAHVAGLKRLSARASKGPLPATSPRKGCFSFAPLARSAIDRLHKCQVQVAAGLSDEEFARIEAPLTFSFPPDLKAVLQAGLPVGAGFPDWRSGGLKQLRLALSLPIAGLCYAVSKGQLWCKHWGPRPSDTDLAVSIARSALRKAPVLIPVYRHCYIPASPHLAGNPIFFVSEKDVFCSAYDLASFFDQQNFTSPDFSLPFDFYSLDIASTGRVGDLRSTGHETGHSRKIEKLTEVQKQGILVPNPGSAEGDEAVLAGVMEKAQSLRFQKLPIRRIDSTFGSEEVVQPGSEAVQHVAWKCEDIARDLEGWGRNLDAMAKRTVLESMPRRSFEGPESKRKALRRLDHSIDLSNEHHANDRSPSSKGSTLLKMARRIEFWSDLAEKKHVNSHTPSDHSLKQNMNGFTFSDQSFSFPQAVDMDIEKALQKQEDWASRAATPYWLERYLDEMAMILRNGGWKETDVADMFNVTSPSLVEPLSMDPQTILEGLVLYVNLLSDSLRRAGWSTRDVAEAFDVDLSLPDQKRRPTVVPPRLAARIGKLAEYVAQF